MNSCAICGAKVQPGVAHSCYGPNYFIPISLEILAQLKRIGDLLEKQQTALPLDANSAKPENPEAQHKARKRETR
jgi:hypothetical protein